MDILIEIGNSHQKEQMKKELAVFPKVVEQLHQRVGAIQVVIPSDFDETVEELQGVPTYRSVRGIGDLPVVALAKLIERDDGIIAVLSPLLFTEPHDIQTRCFVYIHEIAHVANKSIFPQLPKDSPSAETYLANIYRLFDEYSANRLAFGIIDEVFPSKSSRWQALVDNNATGFTALINDPKYYSTITGEIEAFRYHGDVTRFLERTHQSVSEMALSIVHLYSMFDHYPDLTVEGVSVNSRFVNGRTFALLDYFEKKYTQDDFDLQDGVDLIAGFMANFGMRFEDDTGGLFCHVVDI